MIKAELTTKSGTKISIEGTTKDVGEILVDMERRERRIEERKLYFERMSERHRKFRKDRNNIVHEKDMNLTDILEAFIENGFFDEKRKIREIMIKLERENIDVPSSTIHPLLSRLVAKQKLKREKGEMGVWEYKKS